jgi:hypothetical protein
MRWEKKDEGVKERGKGERRKGRGKSGRTGLRPGIKFPKTTLNVGVRMGRE